ncbi:MAG: hypothetical protein GY801_39150 [bacterium]|nr:hypothetical protein [bacterium]
MYNKLLMNVWLRAFSFLAILAGKKAFNGLTTLLLRFFARQSLLIRRGTRQVSLEDVALEWQRMFPSRSINHIKAIEGDTAYAEVRVQCPLRGTGNVQACYRLMEYDRAMLRKIGGRLVVLRSQAEAGVTVCEVALRMSGSNMDDLTPAHKRA